MLLRRIKVRKVVKKYRRIKSNLVLKVHGVRTGIKGRLLEGILEVYLIEGIIIKEIYKFSVNDFIVCHL